MNWKHQLKQHKQEIFKASYPAQYELSGGDKMTIKPYKDTNANDLTKAIIAWITYKGGSATRINTMGIPRNINGRMKFTHSTTRKGTADIHAVMKGQFIAIEVKTGRDVLSEYQIREKERIEKAGGLYYVAGNMDEFIKWFENIFKQ